MEISVSLVSDLWESDMDFAKWLEDTIKHGIRARGGVVSVSEIHGGHVAHPTLIIAAESLPEST